jgi:hypothetical protein
MIQSIWSEMDILLELGFAGSSVGERLAIPWPKSKYEING